MAQSQSTTPVTSPTTTRQSPSSLAESPTSRPFPESQHHRSNPNFSKLPPLLTSTPPHSSHTPRPLSQFFSARSHVSGPSTRSRPQSHVFPVFHSSLDYTQVRDFAYPPDHLLYYGPPPEGSTKASTPASEGIGQYLHSRYAKESWPGDYDGNGSSLTHSGPRLPATSFGDGPPWSEDEDLLSPVVTSSKQRKDKSNLQDLDHNRGRSEERTTGGSVQRRSNPLPATQPDVNDPGEGPSAFSLPQNSALWQPQMYRSSPSPEGEPAFPDDPAGFVSEDEPTPFSDEDERSRYSRDYQFTIASPDEEMCGKAVALFDFTRENENELPLLEGQVLWVSYRHGQGWLVAQDPKSGESGLVPEEYVRLVRDIEGGLTRLNGGEGADWDSPTTGTLGSGESPMTAWHERSGSGTSGRSGVFGAGHHYTPIVNHFSTSSKDLEPYPQRHLFGGNGSGPSTQAQNVPLPLSPAAPASGAEQPQQHPIREEQPVQQSQESVGVSQVQQEPELASSPAAEAAIETASRESLTPRSLDPLP